MKNLLLIYGGGGTEHEVSFRSRDFFKTQIDTNLFNVVDVEITKTGKWIYNNQECFLNLKRELLFQGGKVIIDLAIPCIHGVPNETGQLPALFELMQLPYLGCNQETSVLCFNKLSTKFWLENHGIKTTPFLCVASIDDITQAEAFFHEHKDVFVKASNQGSSVGCYHCKTEKELLTAINEAFKLSPYVLIEKTIKGREFELSTFEYDGEIHLTRPCEILYPENEFYTYEEKYSADSKTQVELEAKLSTELINEMKRQALTAYKVLKIRHLSRMDFFLAPSGEVYLNEINTMPGHTKISMFPAMMENYGVKYSEFLRQHLITLSN